MKASIHWGVIGTGGIATDFVQALEKSSRGKVVNVVGSSPEKGKAFAERWGIARFASSLHELTQDREVEAVYVATPHPNHAAETITCLEARKHVLCEKPLCVDAQETERVLAVAEKQRVFLLEAYMYRCHPLMHELVARLEAGVIGKLRHVRADFGFHVDRAPRGRLFSPSLGGGAILDVGGYPVSLARLVAGIAAGAPFAEPVHFDATGYVGPLGADELATALLRFGSGFTAELTCAVFHDVGTRAIIFGDEGKIELPNPWLPGGERHALSTELLIHRYGKAPERVEVRTDRATYALEAELVADTLPALEAPWPAMSWQDTLGNMRALDAWRAKLANGSGQPSG